VGLGNRHRVLIITFCNPVLLVLVLAPETRSGRRFAILFGPFSLLTVQRLLLDGDKPVRLGGRAFDILADLVDRAGEVVTVEELPRLIMSLTQ
jgi:DNA-binding response OmpR family regulator